MMGERKILGLIVLCACLVYGNTLPHALVFDDAELIPHQTDLTAPWDVGAIFSGRYWGDLKVSDTLYRPLTIWSLSLNYGFNRMLGLPGVHPVGYRVVNMLLQAVAGCMVYLFCRQLGLRCVVGLGVTLLFVTHPIHTEVVASIVNRSEMLAFVFGLIFLISHRNQGRVGRVGLCYFFALCCKESAIAFLPLLIWTDICFGFKDRRQTIISYGIYACSLILWLGLRGVAVGDTVLAIPELDNPIVVASVWEQVLTAARVQFDYVKLLIMPVGLSTDYSQQQISIVSTWMNGRVLGFVVLVLGGLVLGLKMRKRHPLVLYCVVGYGILFVPTSNFILPIGTIMAERLVYAPSLFFCVLLGYGLWSVRQSRLAWGMVSVVVVIYSGLTLAQNRTWADEDVFFKTQIQSAPMSAKAHYNLGRVQQAAGLYDEALVRYERAVALKPDYAQAWHNLGALYRIKKSYTLAVSAYRKAISFKANPAMTYLNLGNLYHEMGEVDNTIEAFLMVVRLAPDFIKAYENLGLLYFDAERMAEAEAVFLEILKRDPHNALAREKLLALGILQ